MSNPRTPAHQLHTGQLYARSYFDRNLDHIISSSPETVRRMRNRYGRYLSGFGSEDMTGSTGYDPRYQGQHVYDLEKEDDTFGSGIFDPKGRGGTDNPNMGIFAGHYSLPGYVARDVPFTVMKDVTDITDDADVVSVPGGGMYYVEDRGQLARAAPGGPTWRPAIQPSGWTRYDQVYVDMQGKPVPMSGMGQLPRRRLHSQPKRTPHPVRQVPSNRVDPHAVPMVPAERPVGYESIVHATQTPVGVNRAADPVAAAAPDMPMQPQVPLQSTVNVAVQRMAVDGLGQEPLPSGRFRAPIKTRGPAFNPVLQELQRSRSYNVFRQRQVGQLPECPPGEVPDIDTLECVPEVEEEKKPVTAAQLAIAGLLVGAGVGLVVSVAGKKGR